MPALHFLGRPSRKPKHVCVTRNYVARQDELLSRPQLNDSPLNDSHSNLRALQILKNSTGLFIERRIRLILRITSRWYSGVPCEKLTRATFIPQKSVCRSCLRYPKLDRSCKRSLCAGSLRFLTGIQTLQSSFDFRVIGTDALCFLCRGDRLFDMSHFFVRGRKQRISIVRLRIHFQSMTQAVDR